MTLFNIAYTPKCDSKLILLGQLRKSGISYHDHLDSMILKQEGSIIGVVKRYKNIFIFKTGLRYKTILVQERSQSIYLLRSNSQIFFWHHCLDHANNARVIQASKLVDRIDFGKVIGSDNKRYLSDSKPDNKNNKSNKDADSKPITINKAIEYNLNNIEKLCEACIESKHTRIIKSKKMTLISKRLQEVYANL